MPCSHWKNKAALWVVTQDSLWDMLLYKKGSIRPISIKNACVTARVTGFSHELSGWTNRRLLILLYSQLRNYRSYGMGKSPKISGRSGEWKMSLSKPIQNRRAPLPFFPSFPTFSFSLHLRLLLSGSRGMRLTGEQRSLHQRHPRGSFLLASLSLTR